MEANFPALVAKLTAKLGGTANAAKVAGVTPRTIRNWIAGRRTNKATATGAVALMRKAEIRGRAA